jgi:hypothetical protein
MMAWRGAALACVPGDLAAFVSALNPTKKCRNRRLPGITLGDAVPKVFCQVRFLHTKSICNAQGNSREPPAVLWLRLARREANVRGSPRPVPKRLPSRRTEPQARGGPVAVFVPERIFRLVFYL